MKIPNTTKIYGFLLPASLLLAACGGGGQSQSPDQELNTDYSDLALAPPSAAGLTGGNGQVNMETLIKNGLRLRLASSGDTALFNDQPFSAEPANTEVNTAIRFSGTTVQVEGVQEADRVKYDGRYIYALNQKVTGFQDPRIDDTLPDALTIAPAPHTFENTLTVTATDPADAGIREVITYTLEEKDAGATLMYLVEGEAATTDYVAAISQTYYYDWRVTLAEGSGFGWTGGKTTLQLLDVRDPLNISEAWKLELEGNFQGSRRIGDVLYIVSRYVPELGILDYNPQTEEDRRDNERSILNTPISALLPRQQSNDGSPQPLVAAADCLVPASAGANHGYADILVVTAINLAQQQVTDSTCLNARISGLYVSQSSLYIGGNTGYGSGEQPATTIVHKLSLEAGSIDYRATGEVKGHLGWTNPSFFMDEHEDHLRLVTTTRDQGGLPVPEHHLTVMREAEAGNRLETIAQIPNAQRPEPIGKPQESIFAVRFFGDRAYVVTFRRIDPLYVIDLSDPGAPAIRGELEVPGFSTFLQPLAQNYLLSVGRDATAGGVTQGVKVELFDIADIDNPTSAGVFTFGNSGSWSEALYDHHAIAFQHRDNGDVRLALPINVHDAPATELWHSWSYSGLHLLEATGLNSATPQLDFHGVLKTEQLSDGISHPGYVSSQRSFLHDEAVFYIYGEKIFTTLWGELPPGD